MANAKKEQKLGLLYFLLPLKGFGWKQGAGGLALEERVLPLRLGLVVK